MSNFSRFFLDNYIWILVIILLTIVTIIGYLVDKKRVNKKKDDVSTDINNQNQSVQPNVINYGQNPQVVSNPLNNVQGYSNSVAPQVIPQPQNIVPQAINTPLNYQPLSEQVPNVMPQAVPRVDAQVNMNQNVNGQNSTIPQNVANMPNNVVYSQANNQLNVLPEVNPQVNNVPLENGNYNMSNNYSQYNNMNQEVNSNVMNQPINNNTMNQSVNNNTMNQPVMDNSQNSATINNTNNVYPVPQMMNTIPTPINNGQAVNFVYGPQQNNNQS